MEEVDEFHLLTDTGVYRERPYKHEQELERLAVTHAKEIFTADAFYFDVKQRVTGRYKPRVTDGLLLDFRDKKRPKFWIVEYELSSHDMESTVAPQIRGFLKALEDEGTLRELGNTIYDLMKSDPDRRKKFAELSGEDSDLHYVIDKILHEAPGILVVIDDIERHGEWQVLYDISDDLYIIPFLTFECDGKLIHLANPLLTQREAGKNVRIAPGEVVGSSIEEKMAYIQDQAVKDLCKKCLSEFQTSGAEIRPMYGHWVSLRNNGREFLWIGFRQRFFAIQYLQQNGKWSNRIRIFNQTDWERVRSDIHVP